MNQKLRIACVAAGLACSSAMAYGLSLDLTSKLPTPLTTSDFQDVSEAKAKLGQALFYDKVLSGNQNIACATCHHPDFGSSDGLSLGVGEGGKHLGEDRTTGYGPTKISQRVPRHSPALFNLGAKSVDKLFHDGRVEKDLSSPSGFKSPAAEKLPEGLESALAVQALFPLTSDVEMAGTAEENEIGAACEIGITEGWEKITDRVKAVEGYEVLFQNAYPELTTIEDLTIVHIGNALGAFVASEWQSMNAPFDAYVSGDTDALNQKQIEGADLFFGEAACASCHSGNLFTDQEFHAIAIPQFGPGKNPIIGPLGRDLGRFNETGDEEDRYRFRTPSLRNVAKTAPYGHTGAYRDLEAIVRHHLNSTAALEGYEPSQAILSNDETLSTFDFAMLKDADERRRIAAASEIEPKAMSDDQVDALVAFLESLTDEDSLPGRLGKPTSVPSGLLED